MTKILPTLALLLTVTVTAAALADPPPKLTPGSAFTVPFPDMPPTLYEQVHHQNTKTVMAVTLPKNYDPARKHPLLVYLNGGDGGTATNANVPTAITDGQDFVCVALPLFREKLDPPPDIAIREADFKFTWPLHKRMLAKLDELVPNIDPQHRAIGGFSNGAHTPAGIIDADDAGLDFTTYFSAFYFVEGGQKLQHFDRLKGKPLLLMYGGARNRDDAWTAVANAARDAGVNVTLHKMENTAHAFPTQQYPVVRDWLRAWVK